MRSSGPGQRIGAPHLGGAGAACAGRPGVGGHRCRGLARRGALGPLGGHVRADGCRLRRAASAALRHVFKAGAMSDRDLETVSSRIAQAQAALADARARLVTAEKQLAYTSVRAPLLASWQNAVEHWRRRAGRHPMFTVVDPSQLQLRRPCRRRRSRRFGSAQPVAFSLNGIGDQTFAGKCCASARSADPSTREIAGVRHAAQPGDVLSPDCTRADGS